MRLRSVAIAATPPLLVAGLWLGAVVMPTGNSARELQDRLDAADAELVEVAALLEESRTVDAQLVAMTGELDRLASSVPPTADVAGVVRLVDELAGRTGVVVSSVTPQSEQAAASWPGAEVTNVSMSLSGDYSTVMAFIDQLLTADRLVDLVDVDLAADSSAGSLFVDLVVSVYSEPGASSLVTELIDAADQQVTDAAAAITLEATG